MWRTNRNGLMYLAIFVEVDMHYLSRIEICGVELHRHEDRQVRIRDLDLLGRCVRTLREGHISRGAHTVAFDGSGLRSGMYVCRITAFDQIAAVKMHLIE
jgi:hypothetical protein